MKNIKKNLKESQIKNPFDPNRAKKGDCHHCKYPIELYEKMHFTWSDTKHEQPSHYECARDINFKLFDNSKE